MSENDSLRFAAWVADVYALRHASRLTPLKLQKLCFYAVGAALGHDAGSELFDVKFEAWKHGPVNRDVYRTLLDTGEDVPGFVQTYKDSADWLSEETAAHARDAVDVYGLLSAWSLREQSHLEQPWRDAHTPHGAPRDISSEAIRVHFKNLFRSGEVQIPTYLADPGLFAVDGVPFTAKYESLHDLAAQLRSAIA